MAFPNTQGRVRAVRHHDLHRLLTGYCTDNLGEFEISAWELGAGCRDLVFAWFINSAGWQQARGRRPGARSLHTSVDARVAHSTVRT